MVRDTIALTLENGSQAEEDRREMNAHIDKVVLFFLFFQDRHEMNAHIDNLEFVFLKYILNVLVHKVVNRVVTT